MNSSEALIQFTCITLNRPMTRIECVKKRAHAKRCLGKKTIWTNPPTFVCLDCQEWRCNLLKEKEENVMPISADMNVILQPPTPWKDANPEYHADESEPRRVTLKGDIVPPYKCTKHGHHNGRRNPRDGKILPSCPMCFEENRIEKLKAKAGVVSAFHVHLESMPWLAAWLGEQASAAGMTPGKYVTRMLLEAMPADEIKAGMLGTSK